MKPIPEMTDQELSEAIAVEVRGWHEGDISGRWLQSDGEGTNYYNHDRTDLSDWGCVYFDPLREQKRKLMEIGRELREEACLQDAFSDDESLAIVERWDALMKEVE